MKFNLESEINTWIKNSQSVTERWSNYEHNDLSVANLNMKQFPNVDFKDIISLPLNVGPYILLAPGALRSTQRKQFQALNNIQS